MTWDEVVERLLSCLKVAYFSPLPPERSGIADYSALLLPACRGASTSWSPAGTATAAGSGCRPLPHRNNPEAHGWILDALQRRSGVVVLHDSSSTTLSPG